MKLQGILIDAATPFDHSGALYRAKVQYNLAKWNLTAAAGYVVAGATGEGPLLSAEERVELWALAAAHTPEGKTLVAGVDAQGVRQAVELARRAAEAGCRAVLAETPRYDPSLAVAVLYYRAVADQSPVPVFMASRPRGSGVDLDAETLLLLAQHPNIAGVVEYSGDVEKVRRVACDAPPQFTLLAGDERVMWESLKAGAAGSLAAVACAAPYAAIALWEAFRTREEEAGIDWQARIAWPAALVTARYGVPALKYAMDLNAYYGGPPRLPSSVAPPQVKREVEQAFRDLTG